MIHYACCRSFYQGYRHPSSECCYKLWLPQELRDIPSQGMLNVIFIQSTPWQTFLYSYVCFVYCFREHYIILYSYYFYYLFVCFTQVGRSGRFGHLGLAVNLITYEDRFNLYAFLPLPSIGTLHLLLRSLLTCLISNCFSTGIGLSRNLELKLNKFLHILIRQYIANNLW